MWCAKMTRVPKGKSILFVYISDDLKMRLYDHVKSKYHGLKGISYEVEEALRLYLDSRSKEEFTHTNRTREPDGLEEVKKAILEKFPVGAGVSKKILSSIIRDVCGLVNKYSIEARINALKQDGFLKEDLYFDGSFFRVMGDEASKSNRV